MSDFIPRNSQEMTKKGEEGTASSPLGKLKSLSLARSRKASRATAMASPFVVQKCPDRKSSERNQGGNGASRKKELGGEGASPARARVTGMP